MIIFENFEVIFSLILIVIMIVFFVTEIIPIEVTALSTAVLMVILGILPSNEFLNILSNPAPWTIICMFVLSGALVRTGVLDKVGDFISSNTKQSPLLVIILLIAITVISSAFINNTPVVLVLIPIVLKFANEMKISASKLLIPLSYLAIMGGMLTLIGTSTNLLIDGVAQSYNLEPFGMFEITPIAAILAVIGIIYLFLFSSFLLPERSSMSDILSGRDSMSFLTEVVIPRGSPLIDKISTDTNIFNRDGMRVINILRNDNSLGGNFSDEISFRAGDRIVLRTQMDELISLKESNDLRMVDTLTSKQTITVETLVPPGCRIVGQSLGSLRLRRRFGVYALAIHRRNKNLSKQLENVVVKVGDTLLIEGAIEDIQKMATEVDLVVLAESNVRAYRRKHAPLVLSAFIGLVLFSSLGIAPLFVLAITSVVFVLCSRCIDIEEAYEFIDGKILVLIFSMLAIGRSLELNGLISGLTKTVDPYLSFLPLFIIIWFLYFLTSILTETISNNAVAVVVTPFAITLATNLEYDPRAFVMVIMIAASASFATPIGYQTNTMVYAAGGYKFTDFLKVGLPLNLIFGIVTSIIITYFYI
ncbi:MAG: SLC13 family permease [Paracoccaceae bacterium]